jgi:threonyl-tRNA synthetase
MAPSGALYIACPTYIYLLVLGDREAGSDTVSVRSRDARKPIRRNVADWLERVKDEVVQKR